MMGPGTATRSYELMNMEQVLPKVGKTFQIPYTDRRVVFNTPKGTFTVTVKSSSHEERDAIVLFRRKSDSLGTYRKEDCGNEHLYFGCVAKKGKIKFCKLEMKLEMDESFKLCEIADKVQAFTARFNQQFNPGISYLPPQPYSGSERPAGYINLQTKEVMLFESREVEPKSD